MNDVVLPEPTSRLSEQSVVGNRYNVDALTLRLKHQLMISSDAGFQVPKEGLGKVNFTETLPITFCR